MNRPGHFLCCLLAGSALGLSAAAQSSSPPSSISTEAATAPSLADAVAAAWQLASARHETQGRRQIAQAALDASSAPWSSPPALELGHRSDRLMHNRGDQETEVGLAWSLWQPGQQRAQGAAAAAEMAAADAGAAYARWQVAGEVREAAWQLQLRRAELTLAEARLKALTALTDDVIRRVQAGDLARVDQMAAEAEKLEAAADLAETRQQALNAGAQWTLLTGLTQAPDLIAAETSDAVAATGDTAAIANDTAALHEHPAGRMAAAQAAAARERLAVVATDRRSAPELKLGWRQGRGERSEAMQHSLAIGLRLPLGTADRNHPRETAAQAEAELAEARLLRTRDRWAAEAAAHRAAVQVAAAQHSAQRERAGLLRERARLIERSFRAGESPLPELLRALASATEAEAALIRQQATLGLAHTRHQQSLGLLP